VKKAFAEPSLATHTSQSIKDTDVHYQFERIGFYNVDYDCTEKLPVFNRTCELKSRVHK
jgi:hypothetical protein